MAPAGISWNFAALLGLLALAPAAPSGMRCGERQYPFGRRCCSDCAPGERMRSRCTATADTLCSPCQEEYFSSEHHHGFCTSCTVCSARKGSVEVKKCEKTSDRVCACRAGFMPAGIPLGSVCSPCPEGTFSRGRNENCQPWTNCSSFGKSTVRAGTGTEDAACSGPELPGNATPAPDPFPTELPENGSAPEGPSRPGDNPTVCLDPGSPTDTKWGSLSLLLLCLLLLLVSGMSILLLIIQAARKETRSRPCGSSQQKEGSCRIPIQEQQIDSNSSLIKN